MRDICEDIKNHAGEILAVWEQLVQQEPWVSLPANHRIDSLPDVVVGLVEASLCSPPDIAAHRQNIEAAAEHGRHRRDQRLPEHLILAEYHLLRHAIWQYLLSSVGADERTTEAIMRIDVAITLATTASLWGYHRSELEAAGRWDEGLERLAWSSPFLQQHPPA